MYGQSGRASSRFASPVLLREVSWQPELAGALAEVRLEIVCRLRIVTGPAVFCCGPRADRAAGAQAVRCVAGRAHELATAAKSEPKRC